MKYDKNTPWWMRVLDAAINVVTSTTAGVLTAVIVLWLGK